MDPNDGTFQFNGGRASIQGSGIVNVGGLSVANQPAANLRGIDVPVKAGAKQAFIAFAADEPDAKHAVSVAPSWLTAIAVTKKETKGLQSNSVRRHRREGKVDWQIVR